MTQTAIPTTAIVGRSFFTGLIGLTTFPLTSVDFAREEFGPTLADAQAFVEGTCCTGCAMSAEESRVEGRTCHSCGIQACDCLVSEDAHSTDVFWCTGCRPVCGGYCCND